MSFADFFEAFESIEHVSVETTRYDLVGGTLDVGCWTPEHGWHHLRAEPDETAADAWQRLLDSIDDVT